MPVTAYYNRSNSRRYFIPQALRSVTITDETVIPYGAFENCSILSDITYDDISIMYNDSGVMVRTEKFEVSSPRFSGTVNIPQDKNVTIIKTIATDDMLSPVMKSYALR